METLLTLPSLDIVLFEVCPRTRRQTQVRKGQLLLRKDTNTGIVCICLADWTCPLNGQDTRILLTGDGLNTLMLADPNPKEPGDTMLVVLPARLPHTERTLFLRSVSKYCLLLVSDLMTMSMRQPSDDEFSLHTESAHTDTFTIAVGDGRGKAKPGASLLVPKSRTQRMVDSIYTASNILVGNVEERAERGASKIRGYREYMPEKEDDPAVEKHVNARLLEISEKVAKKTSTMKRNVKGIEGDDDKPPARAVAPQIVVNPEDSKGKRKFKSCVVIFAACITCITSVFRAFMSCGKTWASATADRAASEVTKHHGKEAGMLTQNVLRSVGNVGEMAYLVTELLPDNIALQVASSSLQTITKKTMSTDKRSLTPTPASDSIRAELSKSSKMSMTTASTTLSTTETPAVSTPGPPVIVSTTEPPVVVTTPDAPVDT